MVHLSLHQVLEAQQRLKNVTKVTPLLQSAFHPELYLKAENLQVTGSFKMRAAFNEIVSLSASEKKRGVVAASSGNFGMAMACASARLGVSSKVVMMESSSPLKVERTRQWGAEVVYCENRFEARAEQVAEIEQLEGRTAIQSYDHPLVMAGNGTIALEILDQFPEVENIVVPISGGGLVGGIAFTAKAQKPSVKVWGIQPRGSNAAYLSFQAGRSISINQALTMADGLRVTRPGNITFPILKECVDCAEIVEEASILHATAHFLSEERLVVEPSGAVPLAAVLEEKIPLSKTVLVLSGGNISPEALEQAMGWRGGHRRRQGI